MQVQLYKKVGKYTDKKDGKEKPFTNFYLKCGDALVPVEVCYFPNPKCDNRDPQYNGRKEVLTAFAAILPDKSNSSTPAQNTRNSTSVHGNPPVTEQLQPVSDEEVPL